MLIFKVMVCFLAVFTGEDYVGGLPTIQDSPDNHQAGQSARSASNQGVTNEPASRPSTKLLDYAERREEEVHHREVSPEIKMAKINPGEISSVKFDRESLPFVASDGKELDLADRRLKFRPDEPREDENIRRDVSRRGSSGTDQFLDKSKSRNDEATSSELPASSHGAKEAQRFSSVYAKVDLDEKVKKMKLEFKNDLSSYLTDVLDTVVSGKASTTAQSSTANRNSPAKEASGARLLSRRKNLPVPETEAGNSTPENRRRKSIGDVLTWHQQSTNMRPTRTQHSVQNKRSPNEGNILKLPGYGGRRALAQNPTGIARGANRRHFTAESSSPSRKNQLQFTGLNPIQINAAQAYSNRQPEAQALNIDLSRALYQFGPAQLHALRGVFDKVPPSTQNFKPIAPKQVAYVPPRIVYETKIVPTPFMPFRTEQKTVEALSALLGQDPAQQLQGFNLILRKDRPEKPEAQTPAPSSLPEISRQDIHDGVALGQAFVTPIPSIDINSGLADGGFRFSQGVREPEENVEGLFDQKEEETPHYHIPEDIVHRENPYKTIPIVEDQEETQRGQAVEEKELHPAVWTEVEISETTRGRNEGRYSQHNEEGTDHGDAYAAKYNFGYHVKDYESGNNFGHQESRDGIVTSGIYHVLLPDGRLQNVKYHVDEGGYHAKVSYQSAHSV